MSKLLTIIMPVYNEEKCVYKSLNRLTSTQIEGWRQQVVVVDDGSTDDSYQEIERFTRDNSVIEIALLRHVKNEGKGSAIKTGIVNATGEVLIIQDADLEYDPLDIIGLLDKFRDKNTCAVYGSRIKGSKKFRNYTAGPLFYYGGIALTFLTNLVLKTNLTDQPTCYKSWRSSLNEKLLKFSKKNGFEFEIEMTALFAKFGRIKEVPIHYYPRSVSQGKKINLIDFLKSIITLFECALRKP